MNVPPLVKDMLRPMFPAMITSMNKPMMASPGFRVNSNDATCPAFQVVGPTTRQAMSLLVYRIDLRKSLRRQ
jgi:hypothetical protein